MATQPENQAPADLAKQQKAMQQQEKDVSNKKPQPGEIPAGNPKEHPSRQTR